MPKRKYTSFEFSMMYSIMFDDVYEPQPKKIKRFWVREFYKERDTSGAHEQILGRLKYFNDMELYRSYLRMDSIKFEELICLIGPKITKQNIMRDPISASMRLALTLRFLATGESQKSLSLSYKCSPSSVHHIILETTEIIADELKARVFQKLDSQAFISIGKGFEERWNFPHCIGAIDGKHVTIQAPAHSGSLYFNYKKSFSVVLLAISDHNYNFIMCDIGAPGTQSDGGIFKSSTFGQRFYRKTLPLPDPSDVTENFKNVPAVFVADDAFALTENMLKPYSRRNLTIKERIFNYRLSRARRIIENAFGILSAKWRIFRTTINGDVELVNNIILSSVCLHNWLRQTDSSHYLNKGLVDHDVDGSVIPGTWRNEPNNFLPLETQNRGSTVRAKQLRDSFADHFVGSGKVSWQNDCC